MAGSPVEQFKIEPLVPIKLGGLDVSFTNSSLSMVIAVCVVSALLVLSVRRRALIPGRWQAAAELLYEGTASMIRDTVGNEGRKYFPFVFTLFMFLLFGNLVGLVPYAFTYTSHIIVTAALAIFVFLAVTVIGFARHGLGYLRLFLPEGTPIVAAPLLIVIEILSYLSRPFSLAMRLAINMLVGTRAAAIAGQLRDRARRGRDRADRLHGRDLPARASGRRSAGLCLHHSRPASI